MLDRISLPGVMNEGQRDLERLITNGGKRKSEAIWDDREEKVWSLCVFFFKLGWILGIPKHKNTT